MDSYNLINLNKRTVEREIYRIFPFDKFVDLLSEQRLAFVLPKKWDDPFENFILESDFVFSAIKTGVFGQCWTMRNETDFMWRVYAPNKDGVTVKTNIRLLFNNLVKHSVLLKDSLFIGKVKYDYWDNIKTQFEEASKKKDLINEAIKPLIKTLFIKRKEYIDENEVRIVNFDADKQGSLSNEEIIFLDIEPNDFIQEIIIDPRIIDGKFKVWKNLFEKLGYTGVIRHSQLYKFDKIKLKE